MKLKEALARARKKHPIPRDAKGHLTKKNPIEKPHIDLKTTLIQEWTAATLP